MKIYMSNFFKTKDIPHYSIAVSKPAWDNSICTINELVPPWSLVQEWNKVKKLKDDDVEKQDVIKHYKRTYGNQLLALGMERILDLLKDGMVLDCWCVDGFCHRQVLASYLRCNGIEVEEI